MTDDTKMYAGKFKTVEELEAGYNNAAKVYQENEDLKKKYEETIKVPDAYAIPQGIELHENDIEELKQSSKNSGLSQAQFDKLALAQNDKVKGKVQSFENAKKEIGADNLNLLQDFISKTYPEKAGAALLKEAIKNKEVRDAILTQRTQVLNSSVPGVNKVFSSGYNEVTHEDVIKAREVMTKSRGRARVEAQKRYIGLAAKLAHAGE
ncbi:MAG: hypothetical protein WA324_27880 [Bryobacteraceae bacterium]